MSSLTLTPTLSPENRATAGSHIQEVLMGSGFTQVLLLIYLVKASDDCMKSLPASRRKIS